MSVKAKEQILFGWGGWSRGNPIDPSSGKIISIVDALWLIVFSTFGIVGLISLFSSLLIGPWNILRAYNKGTIKISIDSIAISLIIIFFMMDSLMNAMVNPVYILCAGSLVSYYIHLKQQGENTVVTN